MQPRNSNQTDRTPTVDTVFELLADRHRRAAIDCLCERDGSLSVTELATQIQHRERDSAMEQAELQTALRHCHVPKLREANVVEYEPETERIRACSALARFDPFLELARAEE